MEELSAEELKRVDDLLDEVRTLRTNLGRARVHPQASMPAFPRGGRPAETVKGAKIHDLFGDPDAVPWPEHERTRAELERALEMATTLAERKRIITVLRGLSFR